MKIATLFVCSWYTYVWRDEEQGYVIKVFYDTELLY